MRFGPTSLQVSSVLAKGLRRPKLRSDVRISEQIVNGDTSYVIKNHETNSYNRYGSTEYELLQLCDGTRTPLEISEELTRRNPGSPLDEGEVLEFLDSIEPALWERSLGEKNLAVLERIRDERKGRVEQSSVLYMSFKAWDPNKTLAKLDPYLSWMFTPGFVIFSILLFITSAYLLAGDWARVQADTGALYNFADKSAYDIWMFWILLLALGGIHEFGHGLTCKHFGGDVHQMGFLLIYFTPAFYTDTTDILLFTKTSERQWVIFAGIWIELVLCGLSALVWHFTLPGTAVNDISYKLMLLSGIQGALLNLNPLIKADGYYALSQFLDMDNLREDSFAYLRAWFNFYILRHDIDLPPASRRQRRIFIIFGLTAIVYSTLLLLLVITFVKNVLVNQLGDIWGYIGTGFVIYFFGRAGIRAAIPKVRAWVREKKEEWMKWKMTPARGAGALALAALIFLPPVPSRVTTPMVLEAGHSSRIRATVPGKITAVFVHQGDHVQAGQLLATMENPEITADNRVVEQQLALASSSVRYGQERSDSTGTANATAKSARLEQELQVARTDVAGLELHSPIDGIVETPGVGQLTGQYLAPGDEFVKVVDRSTMRARILVRDLDLQDVQAGATAKVKVLPYPFRTFTGRVESIKPAATIDRPIDETEKLERLGRQLTSYVAVDMDFPNPDGTLTEGMTGTAKISGKSAPLAWQILRSGWRWIRSQIW
jgi:putative peptide zinc metalloprotease protein